MEKRLTTPFTKDKIKDLKAGDSVLITGTIYTARDAAHERMTTNFKNGIPFPIDLTDNVIIMQVHVLLNPAKLSALADRLQPAEWTRTRRCF